MTFFEQELRKLFADGSIIQSPQFLGQACFGELDRDLRVRVQFTDPSVLRSYDVLSVSILNRTGGVVDRLELKIVDMIGRKTIPNNPNFKDGLAPHIWDYYGKLEWYGYQPTAADYQAMRQSVNRYLNVFRDKSMEQIRSGPILVYICAPLRGEVEKNIDFARERRKKYSSRGMYLFALICFSLPSQTHPTRPRIRRRDRWACGLWSPVSRSMSTARSGQMVCGLKSTMRKGWGSRL